jgi:hypothetical protein
MQKHSFLSLLKYPSIRTSFLIMCYIWFSTSGIYYGLSIHLKNLPGDIYTNGIFIYTAELFAYMITGWLINKPRYGRRGSMILFEAVSFTSYLILILFDFKTYEYGKTILSFVGRFAISGVYNIIYTYTTEVYPTVVRAKGFGFNSICARLGGIIFPLFLELMGEYVVNLFASVNLLALVLLFFIPETLGRPLEDNIRETTK